jgi:hypothetical protein
MNLHPSVLAHAAFMDRPHSRQDLENIVGLIEEKVSLVRNREASYARGAQFSRKPVPQREQYRAPINSVKCWNCGRIGHVQRYCRYKPSPSGNEWAPGGQTTPGRES